MAFAPLHTLFTWLAAALALLAAWAVCGTARWAALRLPPRWRRRLVGVAGYAVLVLFGVVFVTPFVWMLVTSVKVDTQIFSNHVQWLPTVPTVRETVVDSNGIRKTSYVPVEVLHRGASAQRVALLADLEHGQSRVRSLDAAGTEQLVRTADLTPVRGVAPQWHNYPDALQSFPFWLYTGNTLLICILTMAGTVISAALPAYGFARVRWRGRDTLFFILLATIMLPPQVTMLPVFLIFRTLHWTGTFLPLVVPAFFGPAFYIFLLRQFFRTLPQELSDAARIDGCSEMGILARVIAPISKPALATVALLAFTSAWMDFSGPLIYLHDERTYTLAVGLLAFLGRHGGEWALLMAASTVITLPMLVIFFFAQKTYIQGIALTGMKG